MDRAGEIARLSLDPDADFQTILEANRADAKAHADERAKREAESLALRKAKERVGYDAGLRRVFLSDPKGRTLEDALMALGETIIDLLLKILAAQKADDFTSDAYMAMCKSLVKKTARFSAMVHAINRAIDAKWKRLTGVVPPQARTIEDLKYIVIPWWKEQAAAVGIDPNKILESDENLIANLEPIITGRLRLRRLQAATITARDKMAAAAKPDKILRGSVEILEAIARPGGKDSWRQVKRLNEKDGKGTGPIRYDGNVPYVKKSALLAWWKKMHERYEENQQPDQDRQAVKDLIAQGERRGAGNLAAGDEGLTLAATPKTRTHHRKKRK